MKKQIISLLLCAVMLLPGLVVKTSAAANTARQNAAYYLKKGDYIVISPAEKWDGGKRVAVTTTEWELTAQHSGTANGNDIQTWKYGVSDKFYIENWELRTGDGAGCFRIQCKNFRESSGGRFWDIEGRSKKTGGNVHVWDYKQSASQWFYLEDDGDGDPETFFLKNRNSNLYIVPRDYFNDPAKDCRSGRNSWSDEGCNLEQSNFAFRWRIQVLNRDAANDMGKKDKYANWMSMLPDTRYLADINIPGTHDSGTANVEGSWNSSYNIVACQKYFIEQQLYAGVRALDIRTSWNDDSKDMVLVHGKDYMVCHTPDHGNNAKNKTFRSVLDTVIAFLRSHPTETVIMTLKIDAGDNEKGTETLRGILKDYIKRGSDTIHYFYDWTQGEGEDASFTETQERLKSPTLKDVRGKIVLMTRVDFGNHKSDILYRFTGPDLTQWDASYDDDIHYSQLIDSRSAVNVYIQDDYESPDANKKTQVFNTIEQLNSTFAHGVKIDEKDFVFNYTSKTTSNTYGNSPLGAAKYMNNIIYNDPMFTPGSKEANANPRLGITVMDYVNKQLCRRIIDRNSFPSSAAMNLSDTLHIAGLETYSLFSEQPAFLSTANDTQDKIVWPESAELTYGYVLGEAVLHFADGASGGKEGRFEFVNADDIPLATETVYEGGTISDTPVIQTLKFVSTDGTEEETKDIPVTVHRRPLPIKISDYEVAYGDTFSRADLTASVSITAGGYLLGKDLDSLNETIQKYDIRWLLRDGDGNEIVWPDVPDTDSLSSGTIGLRATVIIDPTTEFPNYDANVELGTWEIIPRTVTVDWKWQDGGWHAELGNILEGDDVSPKIEADGTLTLVGEKAGCYSVADEDLTPPEGPSEEPEDFPPFIVLIYDILTEDTANGNLLIGDSRAVVGQNVTFTVTPDDGYVLETLTVTDVNGNELSVDINEDGSYSFTMPFSAVTIRAGFAEAEDDTVLFTFVDVPEDSYYYDAVMWAVKLGITAGADAEHFVPDAECTRGQLATFLWRAVGEPETDFDILFSDVSEDAYYADAVRWAASLGIVTGYGDGRFGADDLVTREQTAVMLFRFANASDIDTTQGGMKAREFDDFDQVSDYAGEAMTWAVNAGILNGADNRLMPKEPCTRAQIVTMLYRMIGE